MGATGYDDIVICESELAYYVVYRPECASLPRLKTFCDWMLAEAAQI
jgi:hypothetical protein